MGKGNGKKEQALAAQPTAPATSEADHARWEDEGGAPAKPAATDRVRSAEGGDAAGAGDAGGGGAAPAGSGGPPAPNAGAAETADLAKPPRAQAPPAGPEDEDDDEDDYDDIAPAAMTLKDAEAISREVAFSVLVNIEGVQRDRRAEPEFRPALAAIFAFGGARGWDHPIETFYRTARTADPSLLPWGDGADRTFLLIARVFVAAAKGLSEFAKEEADRVARERKEDDKAKHLQAMRQAQVQRRKDKEMLPQRRAAGARALLATQERNRKINEKKAARKRAQRARERGEA